MREAVQNIKGFMFSNMNKQVFIFLFFLLLSAVFWLILTLNETYEKELKVPVHIVNVPKNVVLTSSADDTLRITVRDKGWVILTYMYGEQRPKISINFKAYDRGNGGGIISASDLKRISDQLKESTTRIVSIKPEKLEFFYNNRSSIPSR